jgi:hypothetical protein
MTDFPHKLNEWTEEPIEISTIDPVLNKKGEVVALKQGKRAVMQRVKYTQLSAPHKVSCLDSEHYWTIPDKHIHVAYCRDCTKRQFIRAVYEKVVDGKILARDLIPSMPSLL